MFAFTVAVFEFSKFDSDEDVYATERLAARYHFVARVTVRALTRRDAAAAAYYQVLGRQRGAFLRRLGAPDGIRRYEDDLTCIRREIRPADAVSTKHGLTFEHALERPHVQIFYFSILPVFTRRLRTSRGRNRIGVLRACRLTGLLLGERSEARRN